MVEQKRAVGKDVRVLGETTFEEMGIKPENDPLNLASDRVTLAISGNTRLAFVDHPFSAEHFAQLLGSIAPFGSRGRLGILADLVMPVNAKMDLERGVRDSVDIRRHKRHLGDPRIGHIYDGFVDQNLDSWDMALENYASSDVFDQLQRITFIKSLQDFTPQVFQKWKEMSLEHVEPLSVSALLFYQKGKRFMSFIRDKIPSEKCERYERFAYYSLPSVEKVKILGGFLEQLTDKEKEEFAIEHVVNREKQTLVDLEGKQVFSQKDFADSARIGFVDEDRIKIEDDEGTAVEVVPSGDNWKVVSYKFSPNYRANSLYPFIAWEIDENGQRQFLRQSEVQSCLEGLNLQGLGSKAKRSDVKLGEVEVASFSPEITEKWKKKLPLALLDGRPPDDFEQPMMGAQMSVWVSMLHHGAQLLSDDNPFFPKLEKRIASAL